MLVAPVSCMMAADRTGLRQLQACRLRAHVDPSFGVSQETTRAEPGKALGPNTTSCVVCQVLVRSQCTPESMH